jgi:hypothetical protein
MAKPSVDGIFIAWEAFSGIIRNFHRFTRRPERHPKGNRLICMTPEMAALNEVAIR